MALLFDSIDPSMKFKRGTVFNEWRSTSDAFAKYHPSPEEDPDVTDTDESGDLMPYEPIRHA